MVIIACACVRDECMIAMNLQIALASYIPLNQSVTFRKCRYFSLPRFSLWYCVIVGVVGVARSIQSICTTRRAR